MLCTFSMSLVLPADFQHILRVLNTNLAGEENIMYSLTSIRGVGRRYSNLCLKKAEIDPSRRAGQLVCIYDYLFNLCLLFHNLF